MTDIFTGMIGTFQSMATASKIFWIIMAVLFVISIVIGIKEKAEEGGIAAGIVTGMVVFRYVDDCKWMRDLRRAEWYISVPVSIVGIIAGLLLSMALIAAGEPLLRRKLILPALLLKIIGISVIAGIAMMIIGSIGDGGFIAF